MGLLIALEAAWFAWFLVVPLPNAQNLGRDLRRWVLVAGALPGVIPGVGWEKSHLGVAVQELSHVENLPQRVPIVLAAALIAAAAVALGQLALRALRLRTVLTPIERLPLAFALGATGLGALTLLAGRLGVLAPWPVRIGLFVGWALPTIFRRGLASGDPKTVGSARPPDRADVGMHRSASWP